jgi:hypothetical protein
MSLKFKTYKLCLYTVSQDGNALEFVLPQHKTYELCLEAVEQNEKALDFVPQKFQEQIKQQLGI